LFLISCDKAKETVEDAQGTIEKAADKAGDLAEEAAEKVEEKAEDVLEKVEDTAEKLVDDNQSFIENKFFVGTWTGKLDGRKAVLVITNQEDNTVAGKITISYRQPINQEIKGVYNPETNKLQMDDQLHSRYKGKYEGLVSDDKKTISGTFTTLVDKKTVNFSLSLQ
jgi:hypothetical protein